MNVWFCGGGDVTVVVVVGAVVTIEAQWKLAVAAVYSQLLYHTTVIIRYA